MAVHSWREIPVKDMYPMLLECSGEQSWQDLRQSLRDSIRGEDRVIYPGPAALMVYLLAACRAASRSCGADLDALLPDHEFGEIWGEVLQDRGGCKYFLSYIVPSTWDRTEPTRDANERDAKRCYAQIQEFVQSGGWKCLTLEKLLSQLMEWNSSLLSRNVQRNLAPALELLKAELDQGELYRLWTGWFDRRLDAIPAAQEVRSHLEHGVKQIILNGAPGTGKTYLAKLLARRLGTPLPGDKIPYTQVQFHPSYDYTDFVEGLRPIQRGGEMIYVKLDGHFKKFCRRVAEEGAPDRQYYFLIDEINRADLSKVFGELMYCLESDKRGPDNPVMTQYQNLPTYDLAKGDYLSEEEAAGKTEDVFAKGFYIPENVYIIGTMNDIDRSVESMDFALRRRFEFKEIEVDKQLLRSAFQQMGFGGSTEALVQSVVSLNQKISGFGKKYNLNRQYYISQGQFANLTVDPAGSLAQLKADAWEFRIEPLLREYLRGESDSDIKAFVQACFQAFDRPANAPQGAPQ